MPGDCSSNESELRSQLGKIQFSSQTKSYCFFYLKVPGSIFPDRYSWEFISGRLFPEGYFREDIPGISREDIPGRIFRGGYSGGDIPGRIFPGGYSREDIPGRIFVVFAENSRTFC